MPIELMAKFTALAGSEDIVAELVRQLTHAVRAEPGNLVFTAYNVENSRSEYLVIEEYVDQPAFAAHLASEHGRIFNARAAEHIEGGSSTLFFLAKVD